MHFIPEGYEEVSVPVSQSKTFAEYVEGEGFAPFREKTQLLRIDGDHKYRYARIDDAGEVVKCIRRTNPNAKWDWWKIGGRYSERLLRRDGQRVDIAFKHEIDFESMRVANCQNRVQSVREIYDHIKVNGLINDVTGNDDAAITAKWQRFVELRTELKKAWEEAARRVQSGEEAIKLGHFWVWAKENNEEFKTLDEQGISKIGPWHFIDCADVPEFEADPFAWCEKAPALSAFAVLDNAGNWHEKGEMGWFGCVADEKDDWPIQFQSLLNAVRDDQIIVIVDCHI